MGYATVALLFAELAQVKKNWDGSGARAPDRFAMHRAARFVDAQWEHDQPDDIYPMPNGATQVEYRHGGVTLELEFLPVQLVQKGLFSYLIIDDNDDENKSVEEHRVSEDRLQEVFDTYRKHVV